ncbi:transglutaminase family protein [Octadecabacter antarcticus 307]|uniref:Transglutaminase family protein n=1 Tax=Octadecabacter antarcticus 307 TaxID=391626 RepID=M9R651_9RHOB|nr:transglutaminase family protein [Octadecabacter antarcticus]AGI67702.1 transglutaminase family protein [Octadecabacter antarcticus 307]
MILNIDVQLDYRMDQPTDVFMQVQVPNLPDQRVLAETVTMSPIENIRAVDAESGIGQRTLLRTTGDLAYSYSAQIDVTRRVHDIATLSEIAPHKLPGNVVRYLMPSRYCLPDEVQDLTQTRGRAGFDRLSGGARIAAIRDWIFEHFEYVIGSSNAQTTAVDSCRNRQGVCRDYAHVLIALARAAAIPARFVSVYAPDVKPQDFHAVAEVYLDDAWHLVDPTGMAHADEIVRIGVGLDAAEVSFLSSFGRMTLFSQSVGVTVLNSLAVK